MPEITLPEGVLLMELELLVASLRGDATVVDGVELANSWWSSSALKCWSKALASLARSKSAGKMLL